MNAPQTQPSTPTTIATTEEAAINLRNAVERVKPGSATNGHDMIVAAAEIIGAVYGRFYETVEVGEHIVSTDFENLPTITTREPDIETQRRWVLEYAGEADQTTTVVNPADTVMLTQVDVDAARAARDAANTNQELLRSLVAEAQANAMWRMNDAVRGANDPRATMEAVRNAAHRVQLENAANYLDAHLILSGTGSLAEDQRRPTHRHGFPIPLWADLAHGSPYLLRVIEACDKAISRIPSRPNPRTDSVCVFVPTNTTLRSGLFSALARVSEFSIEAVDQGVASGVIADLEIALSPLDPLFDLHGFQTHTALTVAGTNTLKITCEITQVNPSANLRHMAIDVIARTFTLLNQSGCPELSDPIHGIIDIIASGGDESFRRDLAIRLNFIEEYRNTDVLRIGFPGTDAGEPVF